MPSRRLEVVALPLEGCRTTGTFRRVNCSNETAMLRGVLEDVRPELEDVRANHILVDGFIGPFLEDPRFQDEELRMQLTSEVEQSSRLATADFEVVCPGGKFMSTLCQARIGLTYPDGTVEELINRNPK